MLNVHLVQETNTNTHTKNKNILLAASSAIVGTLNKFLLLLLQSTGCPKNLAFNKTKEEEEGEEEGGEGSSQRTMVIGTFN